MSFFWVRWEGLRYKLGLIDEPGELVGERKILVVADLER